MSNRNREIIDRIRDIRTKNNIHWMRILEIALENAPAETKRVLTAINDNDRDVSYLVSELAK